MKQPETASKPSVPFFARKVQNAPLVVHTGVRAGAAEAEVKGREMLKK